MWAMDTTRDEVLHAGDLEVRPSEHLAIYVDEVPPLNYDRDLFQERRLRSVTANTRVDGEEFLAIAARIGIKVTTRPYPLAEADKALIDLSQGHLTGAAVLRVAEAH